MYFLSRGREKGARDVLVHCLNLMRDKHVTILRGRIPVPPLGSKALRCGSPTYPPVS